MTFWASRNANPTVPDPPLEEVQPNGAAPPMAAKLLSMVGLSYEEIRAAGDRLGAMAADYTARLERIEHKLDLVLSESAELKERLDNWEGKIRDQGSGIR